MPRKEVRLNIYTCRVRAQQRCHFIVYFYYFFVASSFWMRVYHFKRKCYFCQTLLLTIIVPSVILVSQTPTIIVFN